MISIICSTHRQDAISRSIANIYSRLLQELQVPFQIIDMNEIPWVQIVADVYDNGRDKQQLENVFNKIAATEKFVFIVPEYNGSFPGILKLFIDAMEYPATFRGKIGAMVGISSNVQGASIAMSHLSDILNYLGMFLLPMKVRLGEIEKITSEGNLIHEKSLELLGRQARHLTETNITHSTK